MDATLVQTLWFFVPAYLANMAPVFVRGHLAWLDRPLDGGRMFAGQRLLGAHKTWRGVVAGTVVGALVFLGQQALSDAGILRGLAPVGYDTLPGWLGAALGLGTGVGDAVKSFFKRRIAIAPGEPWLGFDQLDFMVGAWLFAAPVYAPPLGAFLLCLPIVGGGSVVVTAIAYELGMKESWI